METRIKISYADCVQQYNNSLYPHIIEVKDIEDFKKVASHDYVCGVFKKNHRSNDDFISSNSVGIDFDNDHSNIPEEWVTPASIKEMFRGVPHFIHYSKSHMLPKKGKDKTEYGPRPRFHAIFPIDEITDVNTYTALKNKLFNFCPLIDSKALDASRFFAGTSNVKVEYVKGTITLNKYLDEVYSEKAFEELGEVIPEGTRNATMHKIACSLLVKYGICDESKQKYVEASKKCSPPLERDELNTIWKSAAKFYKTRVVTNPEYKLPTEYNKEPVIEWDEPIAFDKLALPSFPVQCLPKVIGDYVMAVAETTQTPIDMAASCAIAIMSLCMQGRYKVQGKVDWVEPVNTFVLMIAEPSERKSSILSLMTSPIDEYELNYNKLNAAKFEASRMRKSALENKKKSIESQYAKGKASEADLQDIADKIANFKELKPKKLYVDDITTEKLTSVLSDSDGKTAIISTEGGIFDVLSGMYSKNVNIDVFLKGYSGDTIRVDRIGRSSELIKSPALTILLSVQPSVLSSFMDNSTFDGRGLTTRFLYAIPESMIGKRKYNTKPIPPEVARLYEVKIQELLSEEDEMMDECIIKLSSEASTALENFYNENESIMGDNPDIKTWRGKLVGNVLRISALLARFNTTAYNPYLDTNINITVSKQDMDNAIAIGRYFTEHATASYSLMGIDPVNKQCEYVISTLKRLGLTEFNNRVLMRTCRTRAFKNTNSIIPVITRLTEYGYIQAKPNNNKASTTYLVNPLIFNQKNK